MKIIYYVTLGVALSVLSQAAAENQLAGTLTHVQGEVQIFSHPSKVSEGPGPHALFEGETYSVRPATIGDKVDEGNIVRTAPGATAKVIFENGDQMQVGSGTAYRIRWQGAEGGTSVRLLYGKMRNVISKFGPRNRMEVRAADVTMGVRGTDFFVQTGGDAGTTSVVTLRGAVEVKTSEGVKSTVGAGSAALAAKDVSVRALTKEDLRSIQQVSAAVTASPTKTERGLAPEVARRVVTLEKQALENTMADIKSGDQKFFAYLSKDPATKAASADTVNLEAVARLMESAPAGKKGKPTLGDFDSKDDHYGKYFKAID
jgi:hypothetical protein